MWCFFFSITNILLAFFFQNRFSPLFFTNLAQNGTKITPPSISVYSQKTFFSSSRKLCCFFCFCCASDGSAVIILFHHSDLVLNNPFLLPFFSLKQLPSTSKMTPGKHTSFSNVFRQNVNGGYYQQGKCFDICKKKKKLCLLFFSKLGRKPCPERPSYSEIAKGKQRTKRI